MGNAGGPPEAVAVDDRGDAVSVYFSVEGRGMLSSGDGGRTFTVRYGE